MKLNYYPDTDSLYINLSIAWADALLEELGRVATIRAYDQVR